MTKNENQLRSIIRKEVMREFADNTVPREKGIHDQIVDITKAAAQGLNALQSLKKREMPSQKARNAVETSITALEHIFTDMSQNPTRYLDGGDPSELVTQHMSGLDDREAALQDGAEHGV